MRFESTLTDEALLKLLGERLMRLRLTKNLTQQQLAEQAGLSLRTVQRMELGTAATQLSGFLRACRVLGLLEQFDHLIPEPPVSPIEQLKFRSRERKRATGTRAKRPQQKRWEWASR